MQLFGGGGSKSGLGGGRGGGDGVNPDAQKFRFYYIDENGKQRSIDIMARDFEQAKKYLKEVKDALKIKKLVKVGRVTERASSNVTDVVSSITDPQSGSKIDLSESRLQYTDGPQSIGSDRLDTIKSVAKQIRGKDKENLTIFDNNGKDIYNKEGEVDRVSAPQSIRQQGSYDIHNHARRDGFLGGTFSVSDDKGQGDMSNFVKNKNTQAKFVSAKEGTYYIEKTSNFRADSFYKHMKSAESRIEGKRQSSLKSLENQYSRDKISYNTYLEKHRQIQNKSLVDMHNEFLKNQKKFGYNYGLIK